ncbi:MAG: leucine-rich repeat protein [Ruminococcus sp.]|nr:leucine-rich repeat protein [Ruminococcus sp.]
MTTKKFLAGLMAASMVLGASPVRPQSCGSLFTAYAESASVGEETLDGITYELYEDHAEIVKSEEGLSGELVLPSYVGELPVTVIGDEAFKAMYELNAVTFPEKLERIGRSAFEDCALVKIVLPDTIKEVGDKAFLNCGVLEEVEAPEGFANYGIHCFRGTEWLNMQCNHDGFYIVGNTIVDTGNIFERVITEGVEELGPDCLYTYSVVQELTLAKSVKKVYASSFTNQGRIFEIYVLNPDCEFIDDLDDYPSGYYFNGVIYGYENSPAQEFAEKKGWNFQILGDQEYALASDGDLKFYVYSDHAMVVYCDRRFEGDLVIPSEIQGVPVTEIVPGSFNNVPGLRSVVIPDSVKKIGDAAFMESEALESVTLPDDVEIGAIVFRGTKWANDLLEKDGCIINNDTLIDGSGMKGDVVIPEGIRTIAPFAFQYDDDMTSVSIPDTVTTIGKGAFSCCNGLTSVVIPDSVSEIPPVCFYQCSGLEEVKLPEEINGWGFDAFTGTPWMEKKVAVESLIIENGILVNGLGCQGRVEIPDTVTCIGANAFAENKDITEVIIPDSVKTICENAFGGCSELRSIEIPDSVEVIENSVFGLCTNLETVKFPKKVKSFGSGMFIGCPKLESVELPVGVTVLGNSDFVDCGVKSIIIPDTVTELELNCIKDCTSLESLVIPKSVRRICDGAITGCTSLKKITIESPYTMITFKSSTISSNQIVGGSDGMFSGVIRGCKYSTAEAYAKRFGYKFEAIDEDDTEVVLGDANCDTSVDMSDSVLIMQSIANPDKYGLEGTHENHMTIEGSVNGDCCGGLDGISVLDAQAIQRKLLGVSTLPV